MWILLTGVFVFDTLIKLIRRRYKLSAQFHDEGIIVIKKDQKDDLVSWLNICVKELNEILKLNVPIEISVQFGKNYAEIH